MHQLSHAPVTFASEIEQLWEEYEAQSTRESQWVKIVDRLLPFVLNLATQGRSWKEKGINETPALISGFIIPKADYTAIGPVSFEYLWKETVCRLYRFWLTASHQQTRFFQADGVRMPPYFLKMR